MNCAFCGRVADRLDIFIPDGVPCIVQIYDDMFSCPIIVLYEPRFTGVLGARSRATAAPPARAAQPRQDSLIDEAVLQLHLTCGLHQLKTMEPVGFAFGAVQAGNTCYTYTLPPTSISRLLTCPSFGAALLDAYRSYSSASQEIHELRLRIQHEWYKIQSSLKVLSSLYPSLDAEYQAHLDEIVETLECRLGSAVRSVSRITDKKGSIKKLKYAVLVKDQLRSDIFELEQWQRRLEPSMFLIARASTESVDQRIEETTQRIDVQNTEPEVVRQVTVIRDLRRVARAARAPSSFDSDGAVRRLEMAPWELTDRQPIYYSSVQTYVLRKGQAMVPVIVNTLHAGPRLNPAEFVKDAHELVKVLNKSEPLTFGMLRCRGFVPNRTLSPAAPLQFDLVFDFPGLLTRPKSLRQILNEAVSQHRIRYSLSARIRLARRLARSVMFVHACAMVHKNIRPECILVFQDPQNPPNSNSSRRDTTSFHTYYESSQQENLSSSLSSLSISPNQPERESLGIPFLVGFESTRRNCTDTLLLPSSPNSRSPSPANPQRYSPQPNTPSSSGAPPFIDQQDQKWHRTLYQHPRRQGAFPEDRYSIEHDMYSLGVCLLEIGLWTSFVVRTATDNVVGPVLQEEGWSDLISGSVKDGNITIVPGLNGGGDPGAFLASPNRDRPSAVKEALVQVAQKRLPEIVGERYRDVVLTCLLGFEAIAAPGEEALARKYQDQEGVPANDTTVGLMFIENVSKKTVPLCELVRLGLSYEY